MPLKIYDLEPINVAPEQREDARRSMNDTQASRLSKTLQSMLWEEFRLNVDDDGKVAADENGVSRILMFGTNSEGTQGYFSPAELGIPVLSPRFVREAEKGNVLVYPAGKEKPVQLQAWTNEPDNTAASGAFSVSGELEPKDLEPPVKKMGFWRGFLRVITLSLAYRGRAREIARQKRDRQTMRARIAKIQEDRKAIAQRELDNIPNVEAERRRRVEQKTLDSEAAEAKRYANVRTVGMENFVSLFGPEPVIVDRLLSTEKDGKKINIGAHSLDEFKDLTVFTKDAGEKQRLQKEELDAEQQQNAGLPEGQRKHTKPYQYEEFDWQSVDVGINHRLTKEEFASVALLACFQPHVCQLEYQNASDYDPTLRQTLIESGIPEKDCDIITGYGSRGMATTDCFIDHGKAREHQGMQYGCYVNVGRKETADAFKAYQQGDRAPLAKIIATGINRAVDCLRTSGTGTKLNNDIYGTSEALKQVKSLMEKDPELRRQVEKSGLEPERMKAAEGMLRMNELDDQARKATQTLAEARARHEDLSPEQKKELAGKIIAARLTVLQLNDQYRRHVEDPNSAVASLIGKFQTVVAQDRFTEKDHSKWNKLPAFQVSTQSVATIQYGIPACYAPMPKIALDLAKPKMEERLKELSGKIVEDLKLGEKSPDELYKLLEKGQGELRLTDAMSNALKSFEKQAGPEKQDAVQDAQKELHHQPVARPEVHRVQPAVQPGPQPGFGGRQ